MAVQRNHVQIDEQILSTEEFDLLSAAVTIAERPFPVALSTYLSPPPRFVISENNIVVTLRPRPRFPPSLQKALDKHALNKQVAPHEPLYIPLKHFVAARNLCKEYALPLEIPPCVVALATRMTEARKHAVAKYVSADDISVRVGFLWHQLLPFQRVGVVRAISELGGRVLIADGMGLGKTLTALAVADYYRKEPVTSTHLDCSRTPSVHGVNPVLVLCPALMRDAWASAVLKWLPGTDPTSVHVITNVRQFCQLESSHQKAQRDLWDTYSRISFVICCYDLLPKIRSPNNESQTDDTLRFPIVLVDECHNLRSITTARTKATMPFLSAAKYQVLISGTPATSRPSELYPIMNALLHFPDCPFFDYTQFLERYCGGLNGFAQTPTNVEELNVLLSTVMIRREKSEVLDGLPPKIRRHVTLEISSANLQHVTKMREDLNDIDREMKSEETSDERRSTLKSSREGLQLSLFHRTADLKIPGVITRVKQLLHENSGATKMILFAHHLRMLDCVQTLLETERITFVRIDGATECSKRSESVDSFQNKPEVRIALLSFAAAGVGITLTAADVVMFAELSWVPSVLVQAEDRAHRIGRKKPVTVEYIIAPGTIDDLMWCAVQGKLSVLNKVIDGSHKKRREELDVSSHSGKRICLSELDVKGAVSDALLAMDMTQTQNELAA